MKSPEELPEAWNPDVAIAIVLFGPIERWRYAIDVRDQGVESLPATASGRHGNHKRDNMAYECRGVALHPEVHSLHAERFGTRLPSESEWNSVDQGAWGSLG